MLKAIPRDYFDEQKGTLKLLWEEEWRALGITQVMLSKPKGHGLGRDVDTFTESRLGALRSPRTRTAYPIVQVRRTPPSGMNRRRANADTDVRSAINLRHNDSWLIDFMVKVCRLAQHWERRFAFVQGINGSHGHCGLSERA